MPASAIPNKEGVSENLRPLWCGRAEGWLNMSEFLRRTEADIARYAAMQLLRFRLAMRDARLGFPSRRK